MGERSSPSSRASCAWIEHPCLAAQQSEVCFDNSSNLRGVSRWQTDVKIIRALIVTMATYGTANGPHVGEAARDGCELMILWGANLVSTGVHSIPFIREAKDRGMKLLGRAVPLGGAGLRGITAIPQYRKAKRVAVGRR